ncbi:hypothetical protein CHH53_03975 [Terribacillus sp. 7520-G]|nr:hypothetical protein CHH53_03975 [Terribacillus sp. 7520-G]
MLYPSFDKEQWEQLERVVAKQYDLKAFRADGGLRLMDYSTRNVYDEKGKFIGVITGAIG